MNPARRGGYHFNRRGHCPCTLLPLELQPRSLCFVPHHCSHRKPTNLPRPFLEWFELVAHTILPMDWRLDQRRVPCSPSTARNKAEHRFGKKRRMSAWTPTANTPLCSGSLRKMGSPSICSPLLNHVG